MAHTRRDFPQDERSRARRAGSAPAPTPVHRLVGLRGRPLDEDVRRPMERLLGADLSAVEIHDDALAARATAWVDALAFTSGEHVAFAPGAFAPRTPKGRYLLAHELAHVIQQRRGSVDGVSRADGLRVGADGDRQERAADAVAARAGALGLPADGAVAGALGATAAVGVHARAADSAVAQSAPGAGHDAGLPVQTFRWKRALAKPFTWPYHQVRGLFTTAGKFSRGAAQEARRRDRMVEKFESEMAKLDERHAALDPYMEQFDAEQEELFESWGDQSGWSDEVWDEYEWNQRARAAFQAALYNGAKTSNGSSISPDELLAAMRAAWARRPAVA